MCCSNASSRDIQLHANRDARSRLRGSLSIGWLSRTPSRGRFVIETAEIAPERDRSRRSGFCGWIAFCVDPIGPRMNLGCAGSMCFFALSTSVQFLHKKPLTVTGVG